MKTSIVFIGTDKYLNFLPAYYQSIKDNLSENNELIFHIFTDRINAAAWPSDMKIYQINHMKWPFVTLMRYKIMNCALDYITDADFCVFADADLLWKEKTNVLDLFNTKPYFGVQHPGFVFQPENATFETNKSSLAYVGENEDKSTYWQGCLWGANSDSFKKIISHLNENVDLDLNNNIVARWHDESHLNRFFINHKNNVNTLHPGYATPEHWENIKKHFPTKAVHLHKPLEQFERFEGIK